jgi:hypothetical protein
VLVPDDPAQIKYAVDTIRYDMEVTTLQLVEEIFGYTFSVPIKADFKVGRWWGDNSRKLA